MINHIRRLYLFLLRCLSTAMAKRRIVTYGDPLTVNMPCQFGVGTHVGKHCHFNGIKVRGAGRLVIGDYFHSGEDILVVTENHNYQRPTMLPYDNHDIIRDVVIGDYVWVGSRAILLPGVELGSGCVIQGGAVVSGKFPANAVIGGNPARIIKYRDSEVVEALVASGSFLK